MLNSCLFLTFDFSLIGAVVTTVAGGGNAAGTTAGYIDGVGTVAEFNWPTGIAQDSSVSLYIADQGNNLIRAISSTGMYAHMFICTNTCCYF